MKPFLAFFVIFLTAFTLGGFLPDPHDIVRLELAIKQAIDSGGVHTCKPGEKVLSIFNENECEGKHFKDCQIELNINVGNHSTSPCFGATFEDCYVSVRGTFTAVGAKFIRSVVDVYDSHIPYGYYQASRSTAEDSIVTCFPTVVQYEPDTRSYSCHKMTLVGNSAFNIPTGTIYPPDASLNATYTEDYCKIIDESICEGVYYDPQDEDPRYMIQEVADQSCCLSRAEDSRKCLSSVPTCSDASSCSTMAVVEGGQIVPVIPGLGKKLNALLYCTILNGDDSDCYLEACLNEGGCGKEWNFFALVNDTMPLALDGVRQAWKSIVNLFPSVLGDYMNYCVEITNTCEKFGDDSFECYQSRANTYAPNSAHDPRSLQYTGINLELRLKAQQRGRFIQDIAEGYYEYPMDMRYEWKNITIEMMKAFMQAQHMLRSLSDETVDEGMLLLDDIDASLQALLLVSDPDEIQYTSYRGVLFQIMAVVRGYSYNPPALPSSGLVLPMYSADFLIDKFGRMKDEMTYQMLGDRLTDIITTVNQDTLKLLSQNAVELVAQDAALRVKLDVAKSEMERAQQQMMNAERKANEYIGKLEGNYRDLKIAIEEYIEEERTKFFLELGFQFLTVSSGTMLKLLRTDFFDKAIGALNTLFASITVISQLGTFAMDLTDSPGDKSAPGLPNPDGSDYDIEAYLDGSANKYQDMAKAANEALGNLGHAAFEGMVNDLITEFAPILEIDNSGVVQTATKVIMDFKTGMAYRKDKYDATVSFASAAGRVAVATAEIVALNQALDNIKNLQEDIEGAMEEQELMGTIAILQMMLSSLTSGDLVGELCNAHMYVNGGEISNSIRHMCGIDGGTVPSVELLEHLVEGSASLGDIVQTIGGALKTFQDAPELFHRQVPKMGTRVAMFTFANEPDEIMQLVRKKVDLGGFLLGEDITFTLYKGSPLLDSFTYNNFNNPMLVGYAALLDGVKIVEPDRNKYIDISLRFSRSFEVYHWELGTRTFLKPTSTEWPVSSSRPMYDDYCQYPVVVSPNSGEEFCFQTSFSNLENPPSAKDEIFAFDSIYTSYTLSLGNPEFIAEMTEEEMANVSLSVFFFYYNTIGQDSGFQALGVRELDQGPSNPEEHHPYHKSGGRLIEFREEAIGGMNILCAYDVNT